MASQHGDGDPGRDRNRWALAPVLGALAVAVIAVAVILIFGNGSDPGNPTGSEGTAVAADKALACPRTYSQTKGDTNGWVPRDPRGLNADDQLVPSDRAPTHAVVCAYLGGETPDPNTTRSLALTGRTVLGGSLSPLVTSLSAEPRLSTTHNVACASYLTKTDGDNYVIGISYHEARLWVSAPGYHCEGATNGSFTTSKNLRSLAAASYAAKKWVPKG